MSMAKPTKCVFETCSVSKSQTERGHLLNVKAKEANEHVQGLVLFFCFLFFYLFIFLYLSEIISAQFGNTGDSLWTRSSLPYKQWKGR